MRSVGDLLSLLLALLFAMAVVVIGCWLYLWWTEGWRGLSSFWEDR